MVALAKREAILCTKVSYVCGRTEWDKTLMSIMAPQAKYFHIDEIMRPAFYSAKPWIKKDKTTYTIVSTLSDNLYKGLDQILKTALCLKKNSNLDFIWHVVGIKSTSIYIHIIEKTFGIDVSCLPIVFNGIMTENNIKDLLYSADVYVHPSTIDNSPNSVCEAQILGVPVIANNVGGLCSLLPKGAGVLVPSNDTLILVSSIIRMCNDGAYARKISEEEYRVARKRHDKEHILFNLINMYKYIIGCYEGK